MSKRTNTAAWLKSQQRWQIKVQKDGVRRSFTSSDPTKKGQREANAKADAWLDEGIIQDKRVSELWDGYAEGQKSKSTTTYKKSVYIGDAWVKPKIGHKKISALTEQNLQDIINAAAIGGKRNKEKGLSKKSLENIRAEIKAFLKYCRKSRVTTMFAEDLTIPAGAKRSQKAIIQPEHLETLFKSDISTFKGKPIVDPYINAYRLAVLTGLRPGELMALTWNDIKGGRIFVKRSINIFSEETQGKNKNAVRAFVMPPEVAEIIEDQRKLTLTAQTVFEISTQHNFRDCWYRYCLYNGIPKITPYEMRHTFVSMAKILPEGMVKQLVGHSKDMDTFGTYGHLIGDDAKAVADALSEVFKHLIKK